MKSSESGSELESTRNPGIQEFAVLVAVSGRINLLAIAILTCVSVFSDPQLCKLGVCLYLYIHRTNFMHT